MGRSLRIGAGLLLALFIVTCTDRSPTGPVRPGAAAFDFSALLAAAPGDPPIPLDSVQIVIRRQSDLVVLLDTTVALTGIAAPGDSAVLTLPVTLQQDQENVTITVTARGLGVTWFTGTTTATLDAGATVTPGALSLSYVGPGFDADSVRIQLPVARLVGGVGVRMTAAVWVPGGILAGVPVGFRVGTGAVATLSIPTLNGVTITGAVPIRDSTWVYAETPMHLKDSVRVKVVPPPSTIASYSGTGQTGPVGVPLPAPVCVRVLDMLSGPFEGQPVSWSVTVGAASLSSPSPTDSTGIACVTVTPTLLGPLSVTAAVAGLSGSPVAFAVTVTGASSIAIISGNAQSDTIGAVLAPLVVKVTDAQSNPVAGARVFWQRIAGTGAVSADTTITDAQGLTQITYTLGATPSADQIRATIVGSAANVIFSATATAGAVRSVTLDKVNDTIPKSGTLQYAATLRDGGGNVVTGSVTWSTSAPAVATVNGSGLATALAGGNARIIAASGGFADTADLWVRALTTLAVSPADTVITAVGDSLLLSAAALDNFGDTVSSGVVLRYITATPTVATVNALTGRVTLVGPGNAVVLARDTVSGVQGPATLRVNQVPTAVTNTADSLVVGVQGRGQIVGRAYDRNGHAIPGRTLAWASRDQLVATVDQLGAVTGVALGSVYVVDSLVDSGGVYLDSTRVDVVPAPPSLIQWAFDSTVVGNGGSFQVALSISRTSPAPLVLRLTSSDTTRVKTASRTVTIPANQSGISVTINGLAFTPTAVTLVAEDTTGAGYQADSMLVNVVSTIEFREIGQFYQQGYFYVNQNETHRAQVFLSDPAPAGGLGVTFVYGAPGRSAVLPSPAIIPAGQLAADVLIQGLAPGTDSVTPTSGGFVGRPSHVSVAPNTLQIQAAYPYNGVLGVGQKFQPYVYFTYAMDHPLQVSLSIAPAIGTVPAVVTIPAGQTSAYFDVAATTLGTATITASAPGWVSDTTTVHFGTPGLYANGLSFMVAGNPSGGYWSASTVDSLRFGHPNTDTVVVSVVSRNPSAVTVDSALGRILPNQASVTVNNALHAQAAAGGDSAWIVMTALGHQPDSFLVHVAGAALTVSLGYPYDGRVGIGTQYDNAGYIQIPYARSDTFWVVLSHSDTAVLGAPDSVAILPASTNAYFNVQGTLFGVDTVRVTRATGYAVSGGPLVYRVDPLRVRPYNYPTTLYTISSPYQVTAIAVDSANGFARPLLAPLTVTIVSRNPAAFTLDSASVRIAAGGVVSNIDTLRVQGVDTTGTYIVTSGAGLITDSSGVIRVYPTPLTLGLGYPYAVGRGLRLPFNYVTVSGGNAPSPIAVTLTHTQPALDSVAPTTVTIPAAQSVSQYFTIFGLDTTGVDTIVAAAPGYVPDTLTLQPQSSRLDVSDPGPNHLTTDPSFRVRTYTALRSGYTLRPFVPVTYTLVSENPGVIRIDSAPGGSVNATLDTAVAVIDTVTGYGDVWISFVGSGTTRLAVTAPGFDSDSSAPTSVTGPSLSFNYTTVTVGKGQLFTGQYVYVNNPVPSDLVVHLARSDSTLPPASQVFGLAQDSVVIAAGYQSSPFFDLSGNANGSAQLIARAAGYTQDVSIVTVGQPQLQGPGPMSLYVGQQPQPAYVYTLDQTGDYRNVAAPTVVVDTVGDSTVAKTDSAARTIPTDGGLALFAIRPLKQGVTSIVFSSTGYKPDTSVITVDTAKLVLGGVPNGLGAGQVDQFNMYVQTQYGATDSALVVTLTSTNPGVVTVPASVTITAASYIVYFSVTGVAPGTASIIATAPHSFPDTVPIVIATPKLGVSLSASTNAGQFATISVTARDSLNNGRFVTAPVSVTLVSSSPGHTTFTTSSLTIAAGTASANTTVMFDTAGSYTVTATASGYLPGSAPTTTTGALVRMVSVNAFTPQTVTIQAGQRVMWRNDDGVTHTTTEDVGPLWSSTLTPGQTYQRIFSTPGTFTYHCSIHGPTMSGTVIVQ